MKRIIFIQIGTGVFAIEIDQVKRFADHVEISDLGDKGEIPSIMGMICLYGEVIPVLDFRWFGQNPMNFCENTIFVVMMSGSKSFAFPISAVIQSCEVPDECFHALSAFLGQENGGVFREAIEWDGTLYLKISAETILKEMA